jgi:hypothetical protein
LLTTCFRNTSSPLAGNFLSWKSLQDLFHDHEVMRHFLAEMEEMCLLRDFTTHSFSFMHPEIVGWESTAALSSYNEDSLERFTRSRSNWLRIKPCRTDLLAPKTHEVTIVYELKPEADQMVAVVHSIYPGQDIGELRGNVTDREKRVFFDWNHPGVA